MPGKVDQIRSNAQRVIDDFGPVSAVPEFGYNAASVAYLDTFVDHEGASFQHAPEAAQKLVSLLGSFLGEAIIATYGGTWVENEGGIRLRIDTADQVHFLNPFGKVHKRLLNGPEDSLHAYFAGLITHAIASQPPSEGEPPSPPPQPRKPWWRR